MQRTVSGVTPAPHQLLCYGWPGNVRELEDAVERAVVLTRRGHRGPLAIPDALAATDVRPLADVERDDIKLVLRAVDGNRSQAVQKLGIGEATL